MALLCRCAGRSGGESTQSGTTRVAADVQFRLTEREKLMERDSTVLAHYAQSLATPPSVPVPLNRAVHAPGHQLYFGLVEIAGAEQLAELLNQQCDTSALEQLQYRHQGRKHRRFYCATHPRVFTEVFANQDFWVLVTVASDSTDWIRQRFGDTTWLAQRITHPS
jgi:hypothetical protein